MLDLFNFKRLGKWWTFPWKLPNRLWTISSLENGFCVHVYVRKVSLYVSQSLNRTVSIFFSWSLAVSLLGLTFQFEQNAYTNNLHPFHLASRNPEVLYPEVLKTKQFLSSSPTRQAAGGSFREGQSHHWAAGVMVPGIPPPVGWVDGTVGMVKFFITKLPRVSGSGERFFQWLIRIFKVVCVFLILLTLRSK